MGPVWQNPIQRTVRTAHLSVLMTAHCASVHNTKQNSSDNLPSYLQTNIIAQMLSIRGEGALLAGSFKNTGQKTRQEFVKYRTIYRTHRDIHSHWPNEQGLRSEQLSSSSHKGTSIAIHLHNDQHKCTIRHFVCSFHVNCLILTHFNTLFCSCNL